jgi:hypothetical protein
MHESDSNQRWIWRDYPPLILYRDDLRAIEQILASAEQPIFFANGRWFQSADELCANCDGKMLRKLWVDFRPLGEIRMLEEEASLFITKNDKPAAQLFYQLDEAIKIKRRFSYIRGRDRYDKILFGVSFILWIAALSAIGTKHSNVAGICLCLNVLLLAELILAAAFPPPHSRIYPFSKRQDNFFRRNKDQIIVESLKVIATAIATIAITLLVQRSRLAQWPPAPLPSASPANGSTSSLGDAKH